MLTPLLLLLINTVASEYLLTRIYLNSTCSGKIVYQKSTAVDLCQHNSYQPGTYRIECSTNACTMEEYTTPDCSGTGTTTKKFDASGQCVSPTPDTFSTFALVADADAQQGFSTPVLRQWQDEGCTGTPVEYIDEGICHAVGENSYRTACVNGTVSDCQYSKSTDCNGNGALCVPVPSTTVGVCTPRGMLGGKASIQFDC